MKLRSSLPLCSMFGYNVLLRYNQETDSQSIITINDTAAFLWQRFVDKESVSVEDFADALMEEYDIDHQTALEDAVVLMKHFADTGFATND